MRKLATMGLLLGLTLSVGCGNDAGVVTTPTAVVTTDDAYAVAWESGLYWGGAVPLDPLWTAASIHATATSAIDVNTAAARVAQGITMYFTPRGCAQASSNANVVTLKLNGCNGPFTLNNVTGTVTLTYSAGQGSVLIALGSSNLKVGGASLNLNAQAVATADGSSRKIAVTTNSSGTGSQGTSISRQGQYTISWMSGDTCASVDGMVTGSNSSRTTYQGFNVCATGCPRSGTVTVVGNNGASLTATYDGTSTVHFTSSSGPATTATLTCQ